jgi:hypothetical protein
MLRPELLTLEVIAAMLKAVAVSIVGILTLGSYIIVTPSLVKYMRTKENRPLYRWLAFMGLLFTPVIALVILIAMLIIATIDAVVKNIYDGYQSIKDLWNDIETNYDIPGTVINMIRFFKRDHTVQPEETKK